MSNRYHWGDAKKNASPGSIQVRKLDDGRYSIKLDWQELRGERFDICEIVSKYLMMVDLNDHEPYAIMLLSACKEFIERHEVFPEER